MKRTRHTPDQIIRKLKTAGHLHAHGKTVAGDCHILRSPKPPTTAGDSCTAA